MTSIKELREQHGERINGQVAFAIDYKPTARAKTRRIVRYAPDIQTAATDYSNILRSESREQGRVLRVLQLSGPVRAYKLGRRGVA